MMKFWGWGHPEKAFDLSHRPGFWPFVTSQTGVMPEIRNSHAKPEDIPVPTPQINEAFLAEIRQRFTPDQINTEPLVRLHHTYGKSYRDLVRARAGKLSRVPDAILYPQTEADVAALLKAASDHSVQVVPFGGGSNIVGGVEINSAINSMAVTVSLRRMNRVLEINEVSWTAKIQAGALGPELEEGLKAKGFTLGHYPDSFEFSTLGGWLATRSAGMQSDAYGKIEDMVVAITLVTPSGILNTRNVPRSSTGPDLNQLVVGSEGTLGIITSATMKIHPIYKREYRGVLVPGFDAAIKLCQEIARSPHRPSTTRVSNQQETGLSFAMRSPSSGMKKYIQKAFMGYVTKVKKFPLSDGCMMILGTEGVTKKEIATQTSGLLALCRKFGAVDLGTAVGAKWYAGKYDYPYLRDLLMDRDCLVDVVETCAPWDVLPNLYATLDKRVHALLGNKNYPGYFGCHLSHSYPDGACLYFTFGTPNTPGNEMEKYYQVKKLIFQTLREFDATLTHHHAVGYELLPWMPEYLGPTATHILRQLKKALDPKNICNPGKLIPAESGSTDEQWIADLFSGMH